MSGTPNVIHTPYTPPMINGVTASKVFLPALHSQPQRIYDYLVREFQHITASEWQQRFQDGLIIDAEGHALDIDTAYRPQTHIYYYRFLAHEIHVPFQEVILFENDHLLVVDKPHFLTVSPSGNYLQETLLVRLKKLTHNPDLTPIHRLDRETAGVMLISKQKSSRGVYQQLFAERQVAKTYEAIAPFRPELTFPQELALRMEKGEPFYTMTVVEGVPNSQTYIELLEHNDQWAHYRLHPHTGKQHQLRVHLNYLGIPIKNDPFYPTVKHKADDDFTSPLQLLAKQIAFLDPINQEKMQFQSGFELTL